MEKMTDMQLQCLLLYLGFAPGAVDGAAGPKTRAALMEFQKEHGLEPDGVCGRNTHAALILAVYNGEEREQTASKTETIADAPGAGIYGSRYFQRSEFRCTCGKCGGFPAEPTKALAAGCDRLRSAAGEALLIVDAGGSGVRCAEHNKAVGGAANSNHLYGKAADLHPTRMTPKQLYDLADKQLGKTGELGLYNWGIHFAPEGKYSRFVG